MCWYGWTGHVVLRVRASSLLAFYAVNSSIVVMFIPNTRDSVGCTYSVPMYMLWSWVHVQYVHVHYIYTSTVHESSIEDLDKHYCTTYQVPPMHPSELCTTPSMHYDYCLTSCTMYLLYIGRNCNSSSGFGHDDNIPLEVWVHVPRGWVWVWIWIWAYVGTCTYADCTEYMMGYSTCLAT